MDFISGDVGAASALLASVKPLESEWLLPVGASFLSPESHAHYVRALLLSGDVFSALTHLQHVLTVAQAASEATELLPSSSSRAAAALTVTARDVAPSVIAQCISWCVQHRDASGILALLEFVQSGVWDQPHLLSLLTTLATKLAPTSLAGLPAANHHRPAPSLWQSAPLRSVGTGDASTGALVANKLHTLASVLPGGRMTPELFHVVLETLFQYRAAQHAYQFFDSLIQPHAHLFRPRAALKHSLMPTGGPRGAVSTPYLPDARSFALMAQNAATLCIECFQSNNPEAEGLSAGHRDRALQYLQWMSALANADAQTLPSAKFYQPDRRLLIPLIILFSKGGSHLLAAEAVWLEFTATLPRVAAASQTDWNRFHAAPADAVDAPTGDASVPVRGPSTTQTKPRTLHADDPIPDPDRDGSGGGPRIVSPALLPSVRVALGALVAGYAAMAARMTDPALATAWMTRADALCLAVYRRLGVSGNMAVYTALLQGHGVVCRNLGAVKGLWIRLVAGSSCTSMVEPLDARCLVAAVRAFVACNDPVGAWRVWTEAWRDRGLRLDQRGANQMIHTLNPVSSATQISAALKQVRDRGWRCDLKPPTQRSMDQRAPSPKSAAPRIETTSGITFSTQLNSTPHPQTVL